MTSDDDDHGGHATLLPLSNVPQKSLMLGPVSHCHTPLPRRGPRDLSKRLYLGKYVSNLRYLTPIWCMRGGFSWERGRWSATVSLEKSPVLLHRWTGAAWHASPWKAAVHCNTCPPLLSALCECEPPLMFWFAWCASNNKSLVFRKAFELDIVLKDFWGGCTISFFRFFSVPFTVCEQWWCM